jgi:hypothetical protein
MCKWQPYVHTSLYKCSDSEVCFFSWRTIAKPPFCILDTDSPFLHTGHHWYPFCPLRIDGANMYWYFHLFYMTGHKGNEMVDDGVIKIKNNQYTKTLMDWLLIWHYLQIDKLQTCCSLMLWNHWMFLYATPCGDKTKNPSLWQHHIISVTNSIVSPECEGAISCNRALDTDTDTNPLCC